MKKIIAATKNKMVSEDSCGERGCIYFKQEVERLSRLVIQKVREGKDIRERLENLIKEKEERQITLEQEVEKRTRELEEKLVELEQFHRIAVGRELNMVELKEKLRIAEEELLGFQQTLAKQV